MSLCLWLFVAMMGRGPETEGEAASSRALLEVPACNTIVQNARLAEYSEVVVLAYGFILCAESFGNQSCKRRSGNSYRACVPC